MFRFQTYVQVKVKEGVMADYRVYKLVGLIGSLYSFESCGNMFGSRFPDQDSHLSLLPVKIAISLFHMKTLN